MAIIKINEVNKTTRVTNVNETMPIIALIGPTTYGPVGVPTEIYSEDEFNNIFGATYSETYPYAAIAAKKYLSQQGVVLFTRLGIGATAASYSIGDLITITANHEGTYGNNFSISIKSAIVNGTTTYKITTMINNETEIFADLKNFTLSELKEKGSIEMKYVTLTAGTALTVDSILDGVDNKSLEGGLNGDIFFNSEETKQTDLNNLITTLQGILQQLEDPQIYEFAIIAMPGICGVKNLSANGSGIVDGNTVVEQFVTLTESRKDCVALIDPFIESSYQEILTDLLMEEVNSCYLSVYYPWYNAAVPELNSNILMPPSVFYLDACATSFHINKPWNAVAGPLTGKCSNCINTVIKVGSKMSQALNNMFINPIVYNRNFGYYIDGNNVLNAAANTRTYSQLGIRQGINYAKRELTKLCHIMSYKQNSSLVRSEVLGRVSKLLEGLKAGEAIYGYRAYINESAMDMADGIIRLTVKIYPTPALEEFVFDFEIVNSESALNE